MSLFNFQGSNIYVKNIDTSVGDEYYGTILVHVAQSYLQKLCEMTKGLARGLVLSVFLP